MTNQQKKRLECLGVLLPLQELAANDSRRRQVEFSGWLPHHEQCLSRILVDSLRGNTVLQHLSLQACSLRDEGVQQLCSVLGPMYFLPCLVHLNLGGNGITDTGATALANTLKDHPTLIELLLAWNPIGHVGGTALVTQVLSTRLQVLDLSGIHLPVRAVAANQTPQHPTLPQRQQQQQQQQHVENNHISLATCRALAQVMPQAGHLQRLDLNRQQAMGNEGVIILAQALPRCWSLQELSLQHIPVRDEGASALAAVLHQTTTLRKLDLTLNCITNRGAIALAQTLASSSRSLACSLSDLRLSQNNIGLPGLRALEQAAAVNLRLVRLDVYGHDGGPREGSALVSKIRQWLCLNRRTKRLLTFSDQIEQLTTALVYYVSRRSKDPSRLYQTLQKLIHVVARKEETLTGRC